MKTTIKADFDRWFLADDGPGGGVMKVVLVITFALGACLNGVLILFDLARDRWDEAGDECLAMAGLFGFGAVFVWAELALGRWCDRAIRRIRARAARPPPPEDPSCSS